jgi:hypothetical protein
MKHIQTFESFLFENSKPNFDKEVQKLIELEIKIAQSANSARRRNKMESWWETSASINYRKKWEDMMTKLRGWSTVNNGKTLPEWMEYCNQNGLTYDYDFGDILA